MLAQVGARSECDRILLLLQVVSLLHIKQLRGPSQYKYASTFCSMHSMFLCSLPTFINQEIFWQFHQKRRSAASADERFLHHASCTSPIYFPCILAHACLSFAQPAFTSSNPAAYPLFNLCTSTQAHSIVSTLLQSMGGLGDSNGRAIRGSSPCRLDGESVSLRDLTEMLDLARTRALTA